VWRDELKVRRASPKVLVGTKRLGLISCLAATALIALPVLGAPQKKSVTTSKSRPQRTRYYGYNGYAGTGYNGGTRYYYGGPSSYYGGWGYPYYGYSSWPYASYGYYPYSYYGGYPYSYYGGYSNAYSYYQPGYGYDTATVAAVQRRLGELGYYHGVVDGVMGPQTRAAITAFESTHGMIVDGMITTRLLNRMGV